MASIVTYSVLAEPKSKVFFMAGYDNPLSATTDLGAMRKMQKHVKLNAQWAIDNGVQFFLNYYDHRERIHGWLNPDGKRSDVRKSWNVDIEAVSIR